MNQTLMKKRTARHDTCKPARVVECERWIWKELGPSIRLLATRVVRREAFASMCGADHPCTGDEDRLIQESLGLLSGDLAAAGSKFGPDVAEESFMTLLQKATMTEMEDRSDMIPDEAFVNLALHLHNVPGHRFLDKREVC